MTEFSVPMPPRSSLKRSEAPIRARKKPQTRVASGEALGPCQTAERCVIRPAVVLKLAQVGLNTVTESI